MLVRRYRNVSHCYYCYYGSTNVWMARVKSKSFGWAKICSNNCTIICAKKNLGKNDLIKVS